MTSVKVFGLTYMIRRNPMPEDEWGSIEHEHLRININSNAHSDVQRITLWHELVHAIEYAAGLDLGESTTDILAAGIFAILKDNPDLNA